MLGTKRSICAGAALGALWAGGALAGAADGVWKTLSNDEGGYLHVTVGPCEADAAKTCGVITKALRPDGENPNYEHLGKHIIRDMSPDGEAKWSGGTIWAPDDDKTYDSNMEVKGDVLTVEGCVMIFCRGQDWTRVR